MYNMQSNGISVYKTMKYYLKLNNLFSDCQHGFRASSSKETLLLKSVNNYIYWLDDKSDIDSIYLDFAKAFDSAIHSLLLINYRGINSNLI